MALFRIVALIRKDLSWCLSNRRILTTLLLGPMFGGLVFFLPVITQSFSEMSNPTGINVPLELNEDLSNIYFIGVIFIAYMTGLVFTSSLILQEKTKGTFLPLLTTPLKPSEFVVGKLFIAFCSAFLFTLLSIGVASYFGVQTGLIINGFSILNLAFFMAGLCFFGCLIGFFIEEDLEQGKVLLIPSLVIMGSAALLVNKPLSEAYPLIQQFYSFNPLRRIFEVLQSPGSSYPWWSTLFNFLFFIALFIIASHYVKFYFSTSREKRSTSLLFTGFLGVFGIYILSSLAP